MSHRNRQFNPISANARRHYGRQAAIYAFCYNT